MLYFPVTETIKNNSKIRKSLKAAWEIFTDHFVKQAVMGLLLRIGSLVIIILISMTVMLVENNFAITALGKLDFISPQLTFPNDYSFKLLIAIPQAIWQTFTISVFTFAYLKYSDAKMSKHKTT
jgi:uncharacterized membrane protein YesL